MFYYIQKVNYEAYLFLIDKSSAGICFVSVKTDLFLCFLFYEITQFSLKVLLPRRSLLFLCVSMGLNAHCHTPTFLWCNFCFFSTDWYCQLLENFPAWRYVSGTMVLRRSNGHLHLASIYFCRQQPPLLSNISARQQRSKLVSAHLISFFVDLCWKKHMNIMSFSLFILFQRLKRHFNPTSGFWWLRKAFSSNLKPCNATGCSTWFVSPILCLFYSISSTLLLLILNQMHAIYRNCLMNLDTLIK